MSEFHFSLTPEEKEYLKGLAALSIRQKLEPDKDIVLPGPPTDRLNEKFGAFVTLKRQGRLRGCIGHLVGDRPLFETIERMAKAAAFEDPRFPPLDKRELKDLKLEISILSPLVPCPDPAKIEIGRHGLLIRKKGNSGLLLPQVPVEWDWDRETFLRQTCRKAGLPENAWKDPAARLFWFEAEVF